MKRKVVKLFDLSRVLSPHKGKLIDVLDRSVEKSDFILGEEVSLFEDNFKKTQGAKHCISVSSGTDALLSIFMSLDLPDGAEVIVPSFTFVASASSIIRAGYKPVFVDLEKDSFVPSIEKIKSKVNDKTGAILFVHLFGEFTQLSELKEFCDNNSIFLVEDCAQSFGNPAGKCGIASAFSFFPAKNLGCLGDGGAVITDDDALAEKIRLVRTHGSKDKYVYEMVGGNFRMDSLQAGFLNILLPVSIEWIESRKKNAMYYKERFKDLDNIRIPIDDGMHSWNQYTLILDRRDELVEHLNKNGVGNAIYYPHPLHKNHFFGNGVELPETEKRCSQVISIPIYPGLTEEEREMVAKVILEFK